MNELLDLNNNNNTKLIKRKNELL